MTFDLVTTPLATGITRLEASAGTGKTYTLAGLFLRLILEAGIPAGEILVVTFTEAATAELRDRIRQRLQTALRALEGDPAAADPLVTALAERARPDKAAAAQALRNALEAFDLVSIHTIHGFCQRTLQDSAFESGILFDVELVTDQSPLLHEIAADYFRRLIHRGDPLLASIALSQHLTPETLSQMLKQCLTHQQLRLLPAEPPRPLAEVERLLGTTFAELRTAWAGTAAQQESLKTYFTGGKKWAVKNHAKADIIAAHAATLAASLSPSDGERSGAPASGPARTCPAPGRELAGPEASAPALAAGGLSTELWKAVEFFSLSAVRADLVKGKQMPAPVPPLFGLCEQLQTLADDFALGHRLAFLKTSRQELENRKQQAKQQSFDDLISRLAAALDRPEGVALASAVRRKFRAALIDEFQDTDPLQWKIFHAFFGQSPDHRLYLIGDPKQAIYGFRGADVRAYLEAAPPGETKHSLATNYRSETSLVRAVNAIFTHAGRHTAFVENGIEFTPAQAAGQTDKAPFTRDGGRPAPFQVWNWAPDAAAATGRQAQAQLPPAVAAEISRLLTGSCALGGRPLQPRQIAVLVESHRQAGWIQSALHELKIPSVEQAMDSVFASTEARELQWILAAILAPANEPLVKAALTTDTLGLDADALQTLAGSQSDWQARLQRLAGYRECWESDGFFFTFSRLVREGRVIEQLLRFPDGERRITNILHLGELLQTAGQAAHLSPLRLKQWLEERRLSDDAPAESFQLRLESDEDAVQIVTIHRSKGLEYPVVFCPFLSKGARIGNLRVDGRDVQKVVLFHADTGELTWDLSPVPAPEHERQAVKESLAEQMRLLYVALTRARNRCYLVSACYADWRKAATALDWLFLPQKENVTDYAATLKAAKPATGDWGSEWETIAAAAKASSPPAIAISELPTAPGQPWQPTRLAAESLNPRFCARHIYPSWFLSSYTQLSSRLPAGHADELDQPDRDEAAVAPEPGVDEPAPATPPVGIFALPPGARTGDCLHKILEEFDFAAGVDAATADWVKPRMEAFGLFEEAHTAAVCEMLSRLCRAPLAPGQPHFTLSRVPKEHRLAEMEFHFPAEHLDADALLATIRNADKPSSTGILPVGSRTGFQPVRIESQQADFTTDRLEACPTADRLEACATKPVDGFLKGFMDLVFAFEGRYYVLDWKSNRLGNRVEEYNQEAMAREIRHSFYDLQYHLYTVALDRYLRVRLPGYDYEKHFGGVLYVFLRGVTPENSNLGIFRARPTRATLARLTAVLGQFNGVQP